MATVGIDRRRTMHTPVARELAAGSIPLGGSLLFSFDASTTSHHGVRAHESNRIAADEQAKRLKIKKERIAWFSKPLPGFETQLLREVRFAKARMARDGDNENDCVLLATRLCLMGFNIVVRNAVGGGEACFSNLRHEFLLVRGEGDYEGAEFIVETRLPEHFVIPHPTSAYTQLLDSLPTEFVGPASRLMPIIQDLCSEMELSFQAQGLTRPPWRRTEAMLSKWMPAKVKDTPLNDSGFSRKSAPWEEDTNSQELVQPVNIPTLSNRSSITGPTFGRKSLLAESFSRQSTGEDGFSRPSTGKEGVSRESTGEESFSRRSTGAEGFSRQSTDKDGFPRQSTGKEGASKQSIGAEGFSRQSTGMSTNRTVGWKE